MLDIEFTLNSFFPYLSPQRVHLKEFPLSIEHRARGEVRIFGFYNNNQTKKKSSFSPVGAGSCNWWQQSGNSECFERPGAVTYEVLA